MANDISIIKAGSIKNGSMVVTCGRTGFPPNPSKIVYNRYVKNTPSISEIQSKFDNRFDDPSYYYGCSSVDGGNV